MARERAYRHDVRCRHCGSNWMPKDGHTRGWQVFTSASIASGVHCRSRAAALPGTSQAAGGSDAHRGIERISGGARSGRKRSISEWLLKKGAITLDEMWTYLGARVGEKRNDLWVWTAVVAVRDGSRWMDFEGVAGMNPYSCACWSVCRMRSATRQTHTECMGRCRSTSMWLGSMAR